ncbi:MAG: TlpA disulfide reductase family protein [Rubricoccaceae bacterium]|nr:TlpA disulfide reductase family protein [Rubricoccaceae bacterium]
MAALCRLSGEEHDRATREASSLAVVETMFRYKQSPHFQWDHWGEDGKVALEAAETFLHEFPDSEHTPRIMFLRALATWYSRSMAGDNQTPSLPSDELHRADGLFEDVVTEYTGTEPAGQALVWRLILASVKSRGKRTPELVGLYGELVSRYRGHKKVMAYAERHARPALFLCRSTADFVGTDLKGETWTHDSLKGKATLIHFWARWCGPCIRELEYLKTAYAALPADDFQIIGVNLDTIGPDELARFLDENDILWPQIHEGKGFDSPLARRYGVRGIPLLLLLDKDGSIVRVNPAGDRITEIVRDVVRGSS